MEKETPKDKSKQAKKLFKEITELEKKWHRAVNKRLLVIEEMKEEERKELKLAEELVAKKNELRQLIRQIHPRTSP